MTEPIDYKQLAEELYLALKENPSSRGYAKCTQVMKKYEDLHKPKMTWYPNGGEYVMDIVNFENRQYVLFWGKWYSIESGTLHIVSERFGLYDALNQAYEELKNQPKRVIL